MSDKEDGETTKSNNPQTTSTEPMEIDKLIQSEKENQSKPKTPNEPGTEISQASLPQCDPKSTDIKENVPEEPESNKSKTIPEIESSQQSENKSKPETKSTVSEVESKKSESASIELEAEVESAEPKVKSSNSESESEKTVTESEPVVESTEPEILPTKSEVVFTESEVKSTKTEVKLTEPETESIKSEVESSSEIEPRINADDPTEIKEPEKLSETESDDNPTSSNETPAESESKETTEIKSKNSESVSKSDPTPMETDSPSRNKPEEKIDSKLDDSGEVADELQKMIKELQDPGISKPSESTTTVVGKETTENLISVLEDGVEAQNEKKPELEAVKPSGSSKPKKYLYKLKSKTGKILHYTSTIPITLKRPVIHLTKMEEYKEPVSKVVDSEKDDIDSDTSSKENNLKENEAPNDNVMPVMRKKGRPPLSSKPPVITLDGNSSDNTDREEYKGKNAPAFSMQTRKRQLKFLPDGRLITPQKRPKSDDKKNSTSSSDSDIDIISSDGEQTDSSQKKFKKFDLTKKFKPEVKLNTTGEKRKYKKIFDFESYYREKTGTAPPASVLRNQQTERKILMTPTKKAIDYPRTQIKPAVTPKKSSSVDPAQLLSSLIGVPISQNQLNVVKFKPKVIQERTNNVVTSTPKKVTFEEDKKKFVTANQSELLKSTPFKIVSKPTYQKILPKPTADKTPILPARVYQPITLDSKFSATPTFTTSMPFGFESLNETLSRFDSFTDSKVVKTKEGPKKSLKRKTNDDEDLSRSVYDVMYDIFDKMPSWNLHVIPDTNCFCMAQVSRGRMGIPTLKKSIELNSEFFAKVYVHQLHCKRYDGVYDTESKIIKLIREIDALAA